MKLGSLLTIAISLLISLAVCEIVVRLFATVRNVGPAFSTYDPVYGRSLKKDFSGSRYTPEFEMAITTNSHGFRGPEVIGRPILFLGDSFTLGYGVSDGEEYPQLVGETLNTPVLNRGIGNAGQSHWVKFLSRDAQEYDPTLVVLQFLGNDYADNVRQDHFRLVDGVTLVEQPIPAASFTNTIQSVIEAIPGLSYSHFISLAREIQLQTLSSSAKNGPEQSVGDSASPPATPLRTTTVPNEALTLALVKRAIELCQENDWPVLLVVTEVESEQLENLLVLAPHLVLPSKKERPDLYFSIDGHWNAKGQFWAAERIAERIVKDYPEALASSQN